MTHPALVLSPETVAERPTAVALAPALAELGLIGAPRGTARYAPGLRFAQLVCFLGCSPTINTSDAERPDFVEIELTPEPRVIVHGIDEGLALPSDELLGALAAVSGTAWRVRGRPANPPLSR